MTNLLARLEADGVQGGTVCVVRVQRVRLAAGPIQREHQQLAGPFAQRILADEGLELGDDVRVTAELDVRGDPLLVRNEAQLVEPADLRLRPVVERELGKRRAAPEREGPEEQRAALVRGGAPRVRQQLLEPARVDLVGRHREHVSRRARDQDVRPERLPERDDRVVQRRRCGLRGLGAVELVHELIRRDDPTRPQEECCQERARTRATEGDLPVVATGLERAEDPKFLHSQRLYHRCPPRPNRRLTAAEDRFPAVMQPLSARLRPDRPWGHDHQAPTSHGSQALRAHDRNPLRPCRAHRIRSSRIRRGHERDATASLRLARQALPPPAPRPRLLRRPAHRDDAEGEESSFHFGIDVSCPDGTPVYATVDGIVRLESFRPRDGRGRGRDGHTEFRYWHIKPAVRNGQRVTAYHTVVGWVEPPWEHVHFAESRDGVYVNPLRPGALGPFVDTTGPGSSSFAPRRTAARCPPRRRTARST